MDKVKAQEPQNPPDPHHSPMHRPRAVWAKATAREQRAKRLEGVRRAKDLADKIVPSFPRHDRP